MTTEPENTHRATEAAVEWEQLRTLYPLYCSLARECVIDHSPRPILESRFEEAGEESLDAARQWFSVMDERIQVHQLRHFLQTTALANQVSLLTLLRHHLRNKPGDISNRDKIDFLLVQFFSHCVPANMPDNELDMPYVMNVLEPVLGPIDAGDPEFFSGLEKLSAKAESCQSLKDLFTSRIIEQGRTLKAVCGNDYFLPSTLAGFTRLGFILRRTFFRLMHQDLTAILDGLRELERRGVDTLDCRKAQFSAYEPISRLRMICQSWKVMFHAEYSAGQPLCILVDLRTVVDSVLAKTEKSTNALKAMAASAGAGPGSAGQTSIEVSNDSSDNNREFPPDDHSTSDDEADRD